MRPLALPRRCGTELDSNDAEFIWREVTPMSDTISAQKPQEPQASQKREAASDGKSIASLILGILGITVVPVICSLLAICFGRVSIGNAHKRGERGNATAVIGTILGWIGLIMPLVVGLIFSIPWWGIAAALMLTGFAAWGIYDTLRNNPG
jgi:hypothetical protein